MQGKKRYPIQRSRTLTFQQYMIIFTRRIHGEANQHMMAEAEVEHYSERHFLFIVSCFAPATWLWPVKQP